MGRGDIDIIPLEGMFFDSTKIWNEPCRINGVECKTNKNLEDANILYFYCFELGNVLVFYHKGKLRSNILLELPISDIISIEAGSVKKRIGKKWATTIKTTDDTIVIHGDDEKQVNSIKEMLDAQKEKQILVNETKKITLTSGDSTKTITIHPYSPVAQDGEEAIFSFVSGEIGYLVTNYRVFMDCFLQGKYNESQKYGSRALTHVEYEDVIASNVEKRREEDIIGGVNSRSSLWNLVQSNVDLSYNESKHHSSSTETEIGDIVFMNDGKQVMTWHDSPDPNSIVKMINSAKAHFKTAPTEVASGGEDPIKALKLRFAKGEITKKQFLEMKDMLE